jgi:hypothetical protein
MYNVHNIVMSVLLLTTTVCIPGYVTFTGVYITVITGCYTSLNM